MQEEIAGLSREALARSEAAQTQAWALRRKQSQTQLRPILSALLGGDFSGREQQLAPAPDQHGESLSGSLLRPCATVEEAMNLTLDTFAETNRPVGQPDQVMKELLSKLDALNREFPDLEAYVGAKLSGFGKTGVSSERQEWK